MDDTRLKKLKFRAWHRGFREADLILGPFADKHVQDFSETELDLFERLLEVPDHDLYGWIVGTAPTPPGPATRAGRPAVRGPARFALARRPVAGVQYVTPRPTRPAGRYDLPSRKRVQIIDEGLYALDWHRVVDGCPHAADGLVALQLQQPALFRAGQELLVQ